MLIIVLKEGSCSLCSVGINSGSLSQASPYARHMLGVSGSQLVQLPPLLQTQRTLGTWWDPELSALGISTFDVPFLFKSQIDFECIAFMIFLF